MSKQQFKLGTYKVQCDICFRAKKRDQMRPTWDGFLACIDKCWYPKHDLFKPLPTITMETVQQSRPRPEVADYKYQPITGRLTTWETANWDDEKWIWNDWLADAPADIIGGLIITRDE